MARERKGTTASMVVLVLIGTVAVGIASASAKPGAPQFGAGSSDSGRIDPRWLPWLGCWRLEIDAVDYREVESTGQRRVCVTARADGRGVVVSSYVGGTVLLEETIVADGNRRAKETDGCSGWKAARWSDDGHRLFTNSELECPGGDRRSFAGVSLFTGDGRWMDVESVGIHGGDHRELLVRRYLRAGAEVEAELGFAPLDQGQAVAAATARAAATAPLTVDDVIEASEWLPSEALEAVIVETDSSFEVDAKSLLLLADSGVPDGVIDLMVALSFPDRFIVDRGEQKQGRAGSGHVGSYGYFGPYFSFYMPFYWHDPYFRYFHYRYPPYYRGGGVSVRVGPGGSLFGGKAVRGQGYLRVRPREDNGGGGSVFGRLFGGGSGSSGSSGRSAIRRGSGSGGGGGAGVSRGGYRRGGSGAKKSGSAVSKSGSKGSKGGTKGSKGSAKAKGSAKDSKDSAGDQAKANL